MTTQELDPGRYRWVVLGVFSLGASVVIISVTSFGLLLPEITEELSLSPSQQGLLGSSVLFANALTAVPVNWWLSRYRPWITASLSLLAGSLFIGFNAWAPTFAVLFVARLGLGLVQQANQAPRTLVVYQWVPRKHFGMANGFMIAIVDILMGFGFILIPLVMDWVDGWRNTLYTWAGVLLVAAALWMVIGRDRNTQEYKRQIQAQEKTPLASLFKYPEIWLICLAVFGALMSRMAFSNFWPTFLKDERQIAVTTSGFLWGMVSFSMAFSGFALVLIPQFKSRKATLIVICGSGQALSYLGLLSTDSVPLLTLLSLINGAFFGFFPVLLTMLFELPGIKPREVAVASALVYTLLWAGGAAGPVTVGLIQDATDDLRIALMAASLTPVTMVVSGLLLGSRRRKTVESIFRISTLDPLEGLSRLLGVEPGWLLNRLSQDDRLMDIARERGIGRNQVRSLLMKHVHEEIAGEMLTKECRGQRALTLLRGQGDAGGAAESAKAQGDPGSA